MVLVFADKNKIILCVDTSGYRVGKLRVRSKERGERNRSRSYLLQLQETLVSNLILSYNGVGICHMTRTMSMCLTSNRVAS